ncbi:MAG: hypothetical protein EOM26_01270 [Alphaproteobacteria bacterium]|nr:hypothetical protein [Alphaproteobacteria bacterium]
MKSFTPQLTRLLKKLSILVLEALAVVVVLVIIVGAAILWRLTSGPIDLEFAREFIESTLNDSKSGLSLTVEKMALQWPEASKPLLLGLKDVRIVEGEEKDILSVDELGLSFSLSSLLIGQVRPQAAYIRKLSLRLVRTEDGLRVGAGDFPGAAGTDSDGTVLPDVLESVRAWARGQGQDGPEILSQLGLVEVEKASVMVEDHIAGLSWFFPRSDFRIARGDAVAEATAFVEIPGGLKTATVEASVRYSVEEDAFYASLIAGDVDPEVLSRKFGELEFLAGHELTLSARLDAEFGDDLTPVDVRLAVLSQGGKVSLPALYEEPLAYDEVRLTASWDAATGQTEIRELTVDLPEATLSASSSFSYRQGEALTVPVRVTADRVAVDDLPALFPPKLEDTGAYRWLVERMEKGTFSDVVASAVISLPPSTGGFDDVDVREGKIAFAFDGVTVDYRAPMVPAENTAGKGLVDFDADTLVVEGTTHLGAIAAKDVRVAFDGLMVAGAGSVDISAQLDGPLPAMLEYLAREPIGYGDDLGIRPEDTKGTASIKANVAFPTTEDLKKEEVKIVADGTVKDVHLPGLVEGLDLKGGPFAVAVGEEDFTVEGRGQLGGRDITFAWQQYLDSEGRAWSSKVVASLGADKALREHFNIGLDDYLSGTLPVKITYIMRNDDRNTVDIEADLTPVLLTFTPLKFVKPASLPGTGSLQVSLDRGRLVEISRLNLESAELSLVNAHLLFGPVMGEQDVTSLTADRLRMGANDFSLVLKRESGGLMKLDIDGKTVDARPFLSGREDRKDAAKAAADEPPMILSVDVLRMITGEEESVRDARMYIETDVAGDITQLEMDARAGNGQIYLRYKPDPQTARKEFHLEASDAGAVLKAFGINKDVRGGKLKVFGQPSGFSIRGGDIAGKAELTNFTVVNAPGLARLLSALSLPGLVQLLGSEGMVFTKLEADFDWFYRPQGAVLVLREGRTSGNSLGLTFAGVVDRATGKIDLSGTIVPLSMVNTLIGGIPVIGDILAGGAGGAVFAATYTVKGPLKEPEISVNPLAALAPGILRRILFEGG